MLRVSWDSAMIYRVAHVERSFPRRFWHFSTVDAHSIGNALSKKFTRFRVESRGLKRGASISDTIGLKVRNVKFAPVA